MWREVNVAYEERFVSCLSSHIAFGVILSGVGGWYIIDISASHGTLLGCWYSGHVTYIDIEWILIIGCWFKSRQCVVSEKPGHPTDRLSWWWTHDIASYAIPGISCVVLRRFVVPAIAQNCKWFCSLFEAIWLFLLLPIRCCLSICWVVYLERNMIYGNGINVCLKMWYVLWLSDGLCLSLFQAITSGIWYNNDILKWNDDFCEMKDKY